MEALKARVKVATGRDVQILGEGWNFGEVANGARFVQAEMLSLNGSGIGSFNPIIRDAVRGGGCCDTGAAVVANQGYVNGFFYDPNANASGQSRGELMWQADRIKASLAGSIRSFQMQTSWDATLRLDQIDVGGIPAGWVLEPGEVVNYVENHDNLTLFDNNAFRLPTATSREDRARVQILAAAINTFSQGVAYFHAGVDTLRSKSLDRNSYDSGDWFNRLDWSYQTNHFGTGLPPKQDNYGKDGRDWELARERLADASMAPAPADIAWARDVFRDLLKIRASTPLLRLGSAAEIGKRVSFPGSGAGQNPVLVATRIDGRGLGGHQAVMTLINVAPTAQVLELPEETRAKWVLHPVQRQGADTRVKREARFSAGRFEVPARSAVVFVID